MFCRKLEHSPLAQNEFSFLGAPPSKKKKKLGKQEMKHGIMQLICMYRDNTLTFRRCGSNNGPVVFLCLLFLHKELLSLCLHLNLA